MKHAEKTRRSAGKRILDVVLIALLLLVLLFGAAYILARQDPGSSRFHSTPSASAITRALPSLAVETEVALTSQEMNDLIAYLAGDLPEKDGMQVQAIYVEAEEQAGRVNFCIPFRYKNKDWVLTGAGELLARLEGEKVESLALTLSEAKIGKLPLPKGTVLRLLQKSGALGDFARFEEGAVVFPMQGLPVELRSFRVAEEKFFLTIRNPLAGLLDQITQAAGEDQETFRKKAQEALDAFTEAINDAATPEEKERLREQREQFVEGLLEKGGVDPEKLPEGVLKGIDGLLEGAGQFVQEHRKEIDDVLDRVFSGLQG